MAELAPLLIAPEQRRVPPNIPERFKSLFDGYTLGWLQECQNGEFYWLTWGLSKDKENTLKCRDEVLQKQGPREVLIWDQPLPKALTADQVAEIRAGQPVCPEEVPTE